MGSLARAIRSSPSRSRTTARLRPNTATTPFLCLARTSWIAAVEAFRPTGYEVLELADGPGGVDRAPAQPRDERHRRGRGGWRAFRLRGRRVGADRVRFVQAGLGVDAARPVRRRLLQFLDLTRTARSLRRVLVLRRGLPAAVGARVLSGRRLPNAGRTGRFPESSSTIRRRLNDGTAYRAVKVPHRPADLEERLRRLGWDIKVTATSGPCYWGQGILASSADRRA